MFSLPLSIHSRRCVLAAVLLMGLSGVRSAKAAELTYPLSVAAGSDGTIYIADLKLPGVWKAKDGKLEIYFQASNKFGSPLNGVRCITLDGEGKLLAGDSATREVYRFDDAGKPQPLTNGGIGMPQGIAVAEDGTLYVSDLETHAIYKVPSAGGEAKTFAAVKGPLGLVFDADKNLMVVSRQGKLIKVNSEGQAEAWGEGGFKFAQGIAAGPEKSWYVSDSYAGSVLKVGADGKSSPYINGEPLKGPVGLAVSGEKLFVADPKVPGIFAVSADGKVEKLPLSVEAK